MTGVATPKPDTSYWNLSANFGGPMRIPGLMRNQKNFQFGFNRNTSNSANTRSELMPTLLQRNGDFSQTLDGFGQPVQIVDPAHRTSVSKAIAIPARAYQPAGAGTGPLLPAGQTQRPLACYNYQVPSLVAPAISTRISRRRRRSVSNNTACSVSLNGAYSSSRRMTRRRSSDSRGTHVRLRRSTPTRSHWQFRTGPSAFSRCLPLFVFASAEHQRTVLCVQPPRTCRATPASPATTRIRRTGDRRRCRLPTASPA